MESFLQPMDFQNHGSNNELGLSMVEGSNYIVLDKLSVCFGKGVGGGYRSLIIVVIFFFLLPKAMPDSQYKFVVSLQTIRSICGIYKWHSPAFRCSFE
jgi:hypothetical protein